MYDFCGYFSVVVVALGKRARTAEELHVDGASGKFQGKCVCVCVLCVWLMD